MPALASAQWHQQSTSSLCHVFPDNISGDTLLQLDTWHPYRQDLLEVLAMLPPSYMRIPFNVRFGDCVDRASRPVVSKARQIGDQNAILVPLNYDRHLGPKFHELVTETRPDYPFWDKIPKVRSALRS